MFPVLCLPLCFWGLRPEVIWTIDSLADQDRLEISSQTRLFPCFIILGNARVQKVGA